MTTTVGLDTATSDTVVGAMSGAEVAFERRIEAPPEGFPLHTTALLPALEEAAGALGGWASVDRIAVGVGPGTFTGLRVGIAVARSLAQALGLDISSVSSLASLHAGASPDADGRPVLAAIDARRSEVFAALYEPGGKTLWEPATYGPGALADRLREGSLRPLAVGDGALRFRDQLATAGAEVAPPGATVHRIAGRRVCELGAEAPAVRPEAVKPVYLREPDAKRWRERDSDS